MSEPCVPRSFPPTADDASGSPGAVALAKRLEAWAAAEGRALNPDRDMVLDLAAGLLVNEDRYGYMVCPCREGDGRLSRDLDIICPCDYRDPDIAELGTCYCGLYVSDTVARGEAKAGSIAERRAAAAEIEARVAAYAPADLGLRSPAAAAPLPIWRCGVCGFLCERAAPPLHCPVCLEGQDEFASEPERVGWRA
jgi:ferredoxin-thioredoxin reductase catalytic subunit